MADPAATATSSGRRVVLVHDWLTGMRGGEKVLESLCRLFPEAELVTLVHKAGSVSPLIANRTIRTSFVQHLPQASRRYRHYLPTFPTAIECLDLDDADLVVSTSHCAAKAVVAPGRALHVCYCHSPMRYAWDQFDAYFGAERVGALASTLARPVMNWLARWDRATSNRVHQFVANSQFVAGRVERYYNRRASVLYPPVDTRFFTAGDGPSGPYFLVVSALVPYKRIEIAIDAARQVGARLKIVGTGPDEAALRAAAGPDVEFLGSISPEDLRTVYRGATALVLPAEEDFGIAPVEAMACGRPVIALGRGGATETVIPGETGWLLETPSVPVFADAMSAALERRLDSARIAAHAATFSVDRFEAGFRALLDQAQVGALAC